MGNAERNVDFAAKVKEKFERRSFSPAFVHVDLDVLDQTLGKVNGYESTGGLNEDDLMKCMYLVPKEATPASLAVWSFNPNLGDRDRIAGIGIKDIVTFVESLLEAVVINLH